MYTFEQMQATLEKYTELFKKHCLVNLDNVLASLIMEIHEKDNNNTSISMTKISVKNDIIKRTVDENTAVKITRVMNKDGTFRRIRLKDKQTGTTIILILNNRGFSRFIRARTNEGALTAYLRQDVEPFNKSTFLFTPAFKFIEKRKNGDKFITNISEDGFISDKSLSFSDGVNADIRFKQAAYKNQKGSTPAKATFHLQNDETIDFDFLSEGGIASVTYETPYQRLKHEYKDHELFSITQQIATLEGIKQIVKNKDNQIIQEGMIYGKNEEEHTNYENNIIVSKYQKRADGTNIYISCYPDGKPKNEIHIKDGYIQKITRFDETGQELSNASQEFDIEIPNGTAHVKFDDKGVLMRTFSTFNSGERRGDLYNAEGIRVSTEGHYPDKGGRYTGTCYPNGAIKDLKLIYKHSTRDEHYTPAGILESYRELFKSGIREIGQCYPDGKPKKVTTIYPSGKEITDSYSPEGIKLSFEGKLSNGSKVSGEYYPSGVKKTERIEHPSGAIHVINYDKDGNESNTSIESDTPKKEPPAPTKTRASIKRQQYPSSKKKSGRTGR